jgi:hypothetical protein
MAKKNKSEPKKVHRSPEEIAPALLQAHIEIELASKVTNAAFDAQRNAERVLAEIHAEIKEALEAAQQEVK